MALQNSIKAYSLIVEAVGQNSHVSIASLLRKLRDHDIDISKRTLERYLAALRTEFGIDIRFDRTKGAYTLEHKDERDADTLFQFLEQWQQAMVVTESLLNNGEGMHYVDFGTVGNAKGLQWFKTLLFALNNYRKISLWYKKFGAGEAQKVLVNPIHLKQYRDRWYIIGWSEHVRAVRTYAFDRIEKAIVKETRIELPKKLDIQRLFRYTIGIDYGSTPAQKVRFRCYDMARFYIESLPLHWTQKMMEKTSSYTEFELFVVINNELKLELLRFGNAVEVVEPVSLHEQLLRQRLPRE